MSCGKIICARALAEDRRCTAERNQRQFLIQCAVVFAERFDLEWTAKLSQSGEGGAQGLGITLVKKTAVVKKLFSEQTKRTILPDRSRDDGCSVRRLGADDERLFSAGKRLRRQRVQLKILENGNWLRGAKTRPKWTELRHSLNRLKNSDARPWQHPGMTPR